MPSDSMTRATGETPATVRLISDDEIAGIRIRLAQGYFDKAFREHVPRILARLSALEGEVERLRSTVDSALAGAMFGWTEEQSLHFQHRCKDALRGASSGGDSDMSDYPKGPPFSGFDVCPGCGSDVNACFCEAPSVRAPAVVAPPTPNLGATSSTLGVHVAPPAPTYAHVCGIPDSHGDEQQCEACQHDHDLGLPSRQHVAPPDSDRAAGELFRGLNYMPMGTETRVEVITAALEDARMMRRDYTRAQLAAWVEQHIAAWEWARAYAVVGSERRADSEPTDDADMRAIGDTIDPHNAIPRRADSETVT